MPMGSLCRTVLLFSCDSCILFKKKNQKSSPRPGEAPSRSPSLAGCRVCPGCALMGFSLSLSLSVPLAVENTTHCEFAYLRDLLIRSVGPCRSAEPAVSGWHPGKGESPPGHSRCFAPLRPTVLPALVHRAVVRSGRLNLAALRVELLLEELCRASKPDPRDL